MDAMRLAEGMTYKWAAMDFPFGGGKTVLAVPRPLGVEERRGLLMRFGSLLSSLGGRYGTGAMAFTLIYRGVDEVEELERRVRSIGARLDAIFATAEADGTSPVTASKALAEAVLARGPRQGESSSFEDIRGRLKD